MLFKDLNPSDQQLIEDILRKDPKALTKEDKAVLNARKDYISGEDFKRMMGEPAKKQEVKVAKKKAAKKL